jgi:hypothetical protein
LYIVYVCVCICTALNHGCGQRAMKARMACAPPATRRRRAHTHAHAHTGKDWCLPRNVGVEFLVRCARGDSNWRGGQQNLGRRRGCGWWWRARGEREVCGGQRKRRRGCPVVFVIPRRDGTASAGVTMAWITQQEAQRRAGTGRGGWQHLEPDAPKGSGETEDSYR